MNLKEALLSFDGVVDNEYLDQYIEIVSGTYSFSENDYTEKHHVIPVSFYYKQRDTSVKYSKHRRHVTNKDSRNYLVQLSFKNHCLAHWLLYKCTTDRLKHSMCVAFLKMTGVKVKAVNTLTEAELDNIQQLRNQVMRADSFYWKPEEINWLISNRANYSLKECAEILHKTYSAVSHQCNELGITCINPVQQWTSEEIIYLSNHFATTSAVDIALVLNRHSVGAINNKAWKLGLKKSKQRKSRVNLSPTQKEKRNQWLIENYLITHSREECAQILNITKDHLTCLTKELGIGIRSKKRYSVQVLCIETGEVFPSKAAAKRATGFCSNAMVRAIKHGEAISSLHNDKYCNVHFKEFT